MVEKQEKSESKENIKMKAGLEIHQQLNSHKLYCNCPSLLRNDEPDFLVNRRLHAVAGEGGEIDVAAKFEAGLDKDFIYQGYDTTCLLELDEQPPYLINQEALQIALHISLLLNCEIVPVSQIMRKTVIDGSNTSGFQRTVLIGRDGWIDTSFGKVGIDYVYLEEDAARGVGSEGNKKIFRLDRLGIPLVEVVTAPDIKTPEQAKELALQIGDILRSCNVKRGLGTIRQDINVSIPGHPRAEIKGFQDPDIFVDVVKKEIERQAKELDEKKELKNEVRGANEDGSTRFLRPLPGSARMYPETDLPLLKISKQIIDDAKKTLPKLRSEVRKQLSKKGLSEEQIKLVLRDGQLENFEELLKIIDEPKFIYQVLIEITLEVIKHEGKGEISIDIIENIVNAIDDGKIARNDVKHVMTEIVKGKSFEDAIKIEKIDKTEIETEIAKMIKEKPGLSIAGYMGLIMKEFKGKVNGKEIKEMLEKTLGRKF